MKLLYYRPVKYFALIVVQWVLLECWYSKSSFSFERLTGCKMKPVFTVALFINFRRFRISWRCGQSTWNSLTGFSSGHQLIIKQCSLEGKSHPLRKVWSVRSKKETHLQQKILECPKLKTKYKSMSEQALGDIQCNFVTFCRWFSHQNDPFSNQETDIQRS